MTTGRKAFGRIVRWPVCLLAAFFAVGGAERAEAARRHAALVVDANTGREISASAADEARFPASLTKMMTLYVVFDLIEQGRLSYNTRIRFSETAVSVPPTKLGLAAGAEIALIDVIKGLIVKSANDAAVAVAEHIAGSEAKFAALMTQKARQIGMASSTFKNAHGLPHAEQVTTARDMITLGLRLQDDFPKHYVHFSAREMRHGGETHRNHNTLLGTYEGTDGIKTGYISSSGYNLVANVRRGNKHVIGVVFGGSSAGTRNQTMRTLLNLALYKASETKTRQPAVVARARRVPEPKFAARPAVAQASPSLEPAPMERPAPKSTIETAKVKTVDVSALVPPRPMAVAPRPPAPARIAVEPVAAPPEPQPQPRHASVMPPPALAGRGAPPSTLQQQAEALSRGSHAGGREVVAAASPGPALRLNGPAQAEAMQIQVGAYSTQAEAERSLAAIRDKAKDLLADRPGAAIAASSNGRAVFRARYGGFDAASAGMVCTELRRRQIDCLVARE